MNEGKVFGTCFRNDPDKPLIYGEMNLTNLAADVPWQSGIQTNISM